MQLQPKSKKATRDWLGKALMMMNHRVEELQDEGNKNTPNLIEVIPILKRKNMGQRLITGCKQHVQGRA